MRDVTIQVFKFSELSVSAKEAVKQFHKEHFGYCHSDEAFASLEALAEHFGGKLTDWCVDFFDGSPSWAKFVMPTPEDRADDDGHEGETEMVREQRIAREFEEWISGKLSELGEFNKETGKGLGECVLTGVCTDEDAIDGFRIAWRGGERDLDRLMQAAFRSWLKACQADCEDEYSDAQFSEMCDANEYEFYADGELYRE